MTISQEIRLALRAAEVEIRRAEQDPAASARGGNLQRADAYLVGVWELLQSSMGLPNPGTSGKGEDE